MRMERFCLALLWSEVAFDFRNKKKKKTRLKNEK